MVSSDNSKPAFQRCIKHVLYSAPRQHPGLMDAGSPGGLLHTPDSGCRVGTGCSPSHSSLSFSQCRAALAQAPGRVRESEHCGESVHLFSVVCRGAGGRRWAGQPSCRFYELINRCPSDPPAEKLPRQLHPEGRADGKLERALILGQEKNILFFPFLSKNMLRPFLSLSAIKTSCGSEQPPQPLPREKANKNSPGGGVSAMSRRWAQAPATSDLDLCPRWAPPNSLFILARAQGTRRHRGLALLIPGAEEDKRTRGGCDVDSAPTHLPISWGRQMGTRATQSQPQGVFR